MEQPKVSIFASAVRIPFYKTFLDSLKGTTVPYEVVFAGPNTLPEIEEVIKKFEIITDEEGEEHNIEVNKIDLKYQDFHWAIGDNSIFNYIHTNNIKPAQCYEVARRACIGETILWAADDCEFSPDLIGKVYRDWKALNDEKAIMSIQTLENGMFVNMKVHSFFGGQTNTPLMAPLGLMSRKVMDDLGGFDRRYICGQYENDAVMRVIAAGGKVHIWGDRENLITIDHYRRHGIHRPFAMGYNHDREILEKSWTNGAGKVMPEIQIPFEPYEAEGITVRSQSFNKSIWD